MQPMVRLVVSPPAAMRQKRRAIVQATVRTELIYIAVMSNRSHETNCLSKRGTKVRNPLSSLVAGRLGTLFQALSLARAYHQ